MATSLMQESKNPVWLKILPNTIQKRLEGRQNLFAIVHNSGWLLLDKTFKIFSTMVVGAWVARYLGPQEYGKLAYVLAIVAFFQVVTTLGLDGIVVREIAKNRKEAGEILGTTFVMRVSAGVFCWVALIGFMIFKYGWLDHNMWLALFVGGSLIFQATDTIDLWFQSQSQSKRTVLAKFCALFVSTSLRVVFIFFKMPLIYFAIAVGVEFGLSALALVISYQSFKSEQPWLVSIFGRGKTFLKESWPLIVSALSTVLYSRIDQVMIKNLLGEKELGVYSAVILFSTGWYFVPAVLYTSLLPSMARAREFNEQLFHSRLIKIFRGVVLVSLGISIVTVWQSENLIRFIYGDRFIQGATVLSIHVFTSIPVFLGMVAGLWIIIERRTKLILVQTTVGAIISIIANSIFIPLMGLVGAAVSSLISLFCVSLFTNFFIERKLFYLQIGINPFKLK